MKNLVMGVATGYDWYKLEPFVTSFNRYVKNADLVLFVDNISDFTRDALIRGGVELLPVPDELKSALIIDARWAMYKKFLDEHNEDYRQVFVADTRDVIFQGDVFETYSDYENFLGYTTEGLTIKNSFEKFTYTWITNLRGNDEAEKLGNEKIICCGTVLGTTNEIKYLAEMMWDILKNGSTPGDEQGAMNYLVYENLLDIKNIVEIDCHTGNIFTAFLFHVVNPTKVSADKILRGDGGIPAVVHQYDRQPNLVQLVNNLYRDKDFQPNENFNDPRSIFEQIFHLETLGKIDDAYKLYTKYSSEIDWDKYAGNLSKICNLMAKSEKLDETYKFFVKNLHGKNLAGYADLISLWEILINKKITPTSELLMLSIQNALMSTGGNGFHFGHINQILSLTNFCMKNHLVVSYPFKMFLGNILFNLANQMHDAKNYDQCINCLNFMAELEIPLDQNFYLFKAKICRESGKKSEALSAYEKALNI